jgi:adenosylmethionine-8-amino-7-oxononanoate aminotransferase
LILGFENSYHGCTYLSSSISGTTHLHETYGRDPNCITVPWDLDTVEEIINQNKNQISCLVIESCSWQAGLYNFNTDWWKKLQFLCNQNEILLIIDDIAFGGGKTGKFFGFDQTVQPDMICLGKALSGGYYPLSACLVSEKIYDTVKETRYLHGFSYSFNMSGILSTLHYLNVLEEEKIYNQYQHIRETASKLFNSITQYQSVTAIRSYGLTWCLDVNTGNLSDEEISNLFLSNGLYLGVWNSPAHTKRILIHLPNVFDQIYFDKLEKRITGVLEQLSDNL